MKPPRTPTKMPAWLHWAIGRYYVTVMGHDGSVPGAATYTLQIPVGDGDTLVVQGGEPFLQQMRQWSSAQAAPCQRPCCLQAPALPGFERLVA